ncbi:MAG: PSD1 and planctomycete cytochrome C domain-containing protein [Akkermansiaceae bacterium]
MSRPKNRTFAFCTFCLMGLLAALVWLAIRGAGESSVRIVSGEPAENGPMQADDSDSTLPEVVGFNSHIRPILSDKCFACHGFDSTKREENLRLDTQEGAFSALENYPTQHAIVPHDPKKSVAWQRITTVDPDDIMPPPDYHKPLTEREINLITLWIEQGADYEEHWAFAPLVKVEVPKSGDANPIDAFVRVNLEDHGLEPAPAANKSTLLRRLSLDLIGLPPTPEELVSFISDESPDAYEKQVERLLASPHYGERMAVPWLDAVRYADTVGYHGDQNARIFPYRDYVIDAFNSNKPFDVFTREQLAGDLLPDSGNEQKIATGFLRLNLMTREGGAQAKEYMAKYAADRVRAIGGAWLGLTTGCAECHDHKFDPITIRDFYSMAAFFGDVRQWGIYANYSNTPTKDLPGWHNGSPFPPEIFTPSRSMKERLTKARDRSIAAMNQIGQEPSGDLFAKWLEKTKVFVSANPTGWLPIIPTAVTSAKGTPSKINSDQTILFTGEPRKEDSIDITLSIPPGTDIRSIRIEALPDPANQDRVGRRGNGKFTMVPTFKIDGKAPKVIYKQADRRHPEKYRNGYHSPKLEDKWQSAPALWEEPSNAASLAHHAVYHLESTVTSELESELILTLASDDIGRVRVSVSPFVDPVPGDPKALRPELASILSSDESDHPELKAAYLLATTPDGKLPQEYKKAREDMLATHAGFAHSMVAQKLPDDELIETHVLTRGNWMTPAEKVEPSFPEFLSKNLPKTDERLTRLDLAEWLLSENNPLPARHFVNRLWKQFFGKGFSNVLDDLGNQGEWPSHPKLIDWLATDFRDSGWDVKHLVRLIVTSETYKQVSASNPDLAEIDPDNRLLSEQSPRRLDAEFIRDNALAISGLMHKESIGGPSAKPYQPAGYWANLNFPERTYEASTGDDQYRRGLYTYWQRTFIHPMMAAFDAPSREECAADRFQSNSPQQALTLLNDPTFVEAAKALANRLKNEKPEASDEERVKHAYLLAISREPSADELQNLQKFLGTLRKENPDVDAMEQLCRVILNLHETITRF